MSDCIFCKIASGEMGGNLLHQDDLVTAFADIQPAAAQHILIVPNKHIVSLEEASDEDEYLLGRMLKVARDLARSAGIAESGYRLIMNTGPDAGQVVFHLHLHLLGGNRMRHPMG